MQFSDLTQTVWHERPEEIEAFKITREIANSDPLLVGELLFVETMPTSKN